MRVEPELPDHPKYERLKRRVGDFAMEALIRIWAHCQQNGRGEFWPRADAEYLEIVAAWDGEPGLLFRSMTDPSIRFVEVVEGGLVIHDWNDTNKQIVKNWENGPKGGRPAKGNKTSDKNPLVNRSQTIGLTGEETKTGNGLPGISGGRSENPLVNPIRNSVNQSETQQEPTQRNVTKHNETKPEGSGEDSPMRYDLAEQCIEFLNAQTGAQFAGTHFELTLAATCLARVRNDVEGVKKMIARQAALWTPVPRMKNCLQPRTLFDPEKFDGYFAQRELPVGGAADPVARRRELEEWILKSPANKQSVYHNPAASEEDRDKLKNWRAELKELSAAAT